MEELLRTRLKAATGLAALVFGRVNWGLRKQGSPLPAVALHRISDPTDYRLAGASGLRQTRVQADCIGKTFKEARDAAAALVAAAPALPATAGGVQLRAVFILDQRDGEEADATGVTYRTSVDLNVITRPA